MRLITTKEGIKHFWWHRGLSSQSQRVNTRYPMSWSSAIEREEYFLDQIRLKCLKRSWSVVGAEFEACNKKDTSLSKGAVKIGWAWEAPNTYHLEIRILVEAGCSPFVNLLQFLYCRSWSVEIRRPCNLCFSPEGGQAFLINSISIKIQNLNSKVD